MAKAKFEGVSYEVRQGTNGKDKLIEGLGNDWLKGGSGDDTLLDLLGNNLFDGGSGSDTVTGGIGKDIFIHRLAENVGSSDRYEGAIGTDVLRLELTAAEWARADVQADIAGFLAHVGSTKNKLLGLVGLTTDYKFTSTNLRISNIEKLQVVVDGVQFDPADAKVTAAGETLTVDSAAMASINLLANDVAPDRVASISFTNLPSSLYGGISVTPVLGGPVQTAALTFTPGGAYAALKAGETKTETFTYTVKDVDGDTGTATATIQIVGVNDGPVAVSDIATTNEDSAVTIDALANDTDVDGDLLSIVSVSAPVGKGNASIIDGKVHFNPGQDFQGLGAGNTETVDLTYTISDSTGTISSSMITIVVTGVNDEPELIIWDGPRDYLIGNQFIQTTPGYAGLVAGDYQYYGIGDVNGHGNDIIEGSGSIIVGDSYTFRYYPENGANFGDDTITIKSASDNVITSGDVYAQITGPESAPELLVFGNDIIDGSVSNHSLTIYGDAFLVRQSERGSSMTFGEDLIAGSKFGDVIYGDIVNIATAVVSGSNLILVYGSDKIEGGGGDDLIYGDGLNELMGDALNNPATRIQFGGDTFVFKSGSGHDRIADFGYGADKLNVSGYGITSFDQITYSVIGSDTIIDLDGEPGQDIASIRLQNYANLTASDFIFA